MKQLLIKLEACEEALEWAGDKTWEEIYNTCHRGDWLLWLHDRTNREDLQVRTLAKGHCANTVRPLMTDDTSLKAVDTAIAFGEGRATLQELDAAANAAYSAAAAEAMAYAAYAAYAAAEAAKAASAADAAYAAAYAAVYVAADDDAYVAADDDAYVASCAGIKNQKDTADIVRRYIPIELWNVQKMIDEVNKQI